MISLIFAESSLELIPKEIQDHNAIISHSKKLGKKPSEILLDNSWHFAAMKNLKNIYKRGRPDIIHFSLLESCSIPLYFENKIKIYVHTINDEVIFLGSNIRLPKSYHRFTGLMEKLFAEKKIISNEKNLLKLKKMNFNKLIDEINPSQIIGLSIDGKASNFEGVAKKLNENSCIVIGGFQKGHFSEKLEKKLDYIFRVDNRSLECHIVTNRILYEYEKTIFM